MGGGRSSQQGLLLTRLLSSDDLLDEARDDVAQVVRGVREAPAVPLVADRLLAFVAVDHFLYAGRHDTRIIKHASSLHVFRSGTFVRIRMVTASLLFIANILVEKYSRWRA